MAHRREVEKVNPAYLNCMWCTAQAFPNAVHHYQDFYTTYVIYVCPAGHRSCIEEENKKHDV